MGETLAPKVPCACEHQVTIPWRWNLQSVPPPASPRGMEIAKKFGLEFLPPPGA